LLEVTLLYEFFRRGTRIRDGVQEYPFILLISRLYLGEREKSPATEDVQASIMSHREEPWFHMHMWVELG
jgi:hypothetical protein